MSALKIDFAKDDPFELFWDEKGERWLSRKEICLEYLKAKKFLSEPQRC